MQDRGGHAHGGQRRARPCATDQMLEAELDETSGDEGERAQKGRVMQSRFPEPAGEGGEGQAHDQEGHPAADRVDDADHHVEHRTVTLHDPVGHVAVEPEGDAGREQNSQAGERRRPPLVSTSRHASSIAETRRRPKSRAEGAAAER